MVENPTLAFDETAINDTNTEDMILKGKTLNRAIANSRAIGKESRSVSKTKKAPRKLGMSGTKFIIANLVESSAGHTVTAARLGSLGKILGLPTMAIMMYMDTVSKSLAKIAELDKIYFYEGYAKTIASEMMIQTGSRKKNAKKIVTSYWFYSSDTDRSKVSWLLESAIDDPSNIKYFNDRRGKGEFAYQVDHFDKATYFYNGKKEAEKFLKKAAEVKPTVTKKYTYIDYAIDLFEKIALQDNISTKTIDLSLKVGRFTRF